MSTPYMLVRTHEPSNVSNKSLKYSRLKSASQWSGTASRVKEYAGGAFSGIESSEQRTPWKVSVDEWSHQVKKDPADPIQKRVQAKLDQLPEVNRGALRSFLESSKRLTAARLIKTTDIKEIIFDKGTSDEQAITDLQYMMENLGKLNFGLQVEKAPELYSRVQSQITSLPDNRKGQLKHMLGVAKSSAGSPEQKVQTLLKLKSLFFGEGTSDKQAAADLQYMMENLGKLNFGPQAERGPVVTQPTQQSVQAKLDRLSEAHRGALRGLLESARGLTAKRLIKTTDIEELAFEKGTSIDQAEADLQYMMDNLDNPGKLYFGPAVAPMQLKRPESSPVSPSLRPALKSNNQKKPARKKVQWVDEASTKPLKQVNKFELSNEERIAKYEAYVRGQLNEDGNSKYTEREIKIKVASYKRWHALN